MLFWWWKMNNFYHTHLACLNRAARYKSGGNKLGTYHNLRKNFVSEKYLDYQGSYIKRRRKK